MSHCSHVTSCTLNMTSSVHLEENVWSVVKLHFDWCNVKYLPSSHHLVEDLFNVCLRLNCHELCSRLSSDERWHCCPHIHSGASSIKQTWDQQKITRDQFFIEMIWTRCEVILLLVTISLLLHHCFLNKPSLCCIMGGLSRFEIFRSQVCKLQMRFLEPV